RIRSLHLIEPPYLDLLPDQPDVATLTRQGLEIQRASREWDADRTAFEFFTMLAGPRAAEKVRASAGWPAVVREAGRLADAEYPSRYPASALSDLLLTAPVAIYTGGRSHPGLQAVAARLAELLPGSRFVTLPEATHAVQLVNEPFDRALLEITRATES
ncbi:MAG: hypothetical protein IT336_11010, partial [Thermomicrobiales bacterium]|nr:hypothetical protein [Thermomicrobiales bacterium]